MIAGSSNSSFNGTYRVNTFSSPTSFTYKTSATGGSSSGGSVSLYPVGVRIWQTSGSPVRPIINGTINGVDCNATGHSPGPVAMELSGGFPFVHNIHTEGFTVGVQIGDLSGTNGATLSNLKLDNATTTGILISDQWKTAGTDPGALPSGNINIFNLDVSGGDESSVYSIIDKINSNTLTRAGLNKTVGYYLYGLNGVMTSALPEGGLLNAFDISGQTTAIYSGSSSAAFSAGPTAVTIGTATSPSGLSVNGGSNLTTSNQTGTGSLVLANTPTLTTPNIGAATGTSLAASGAVTAASLTLGGVSALTTTAHTGSNNIVLDTGPTLSRPTINGGIANNGTGFQTKRVASCATSAPVNSFCNTTVTWNTSFGDINYTVACQLTASTGGWAVVHTSSKSATIATIQITNGAAGGVTSGTVECIGVHDQ